MDKAPSDWTLRRKLASAAWITLAVAAVWVFVSYVSVRDVGPPQDPSDQEPARALMSKTASADLAVVANCTPFTPDMLRDWRFGALWKGATGETAALLGFSGGKWQLKQAIDDREFLDRLDYEGIDEAACQKATAEQLALAPPLPVYVPPPSDNPVFADMEKQQLEARRLDDVRDAARQGAREGAEDALAERGALSTPP